MCNTFHSFWWGAQRDPPFIVSLSEFTYPPENPPEEKVFPIDRLLWFGIEEIGKIWMMATSGRYPVDFTQPKPQVKPFHSTKFFELI